MNLYRNIVNAKKNGQKLLAVLIDPEKISIQNIPLLAEKIKHSPATHIFIGGSTYNGDNLDSIILKFKEQISLPILLFPGHPSQISDYADGILFLSLISGRNPDFLIEHQINAVPILKKSALEIIPTGYMLIESGTETAVARVSKTTPLDRNNPEYVSQTALAGEYLGMKLIYLEAGSGAEKTVPEAMVKKVSENLNIPLIVGGGIRSCEEIKNIYEVGADMIVIGTAFENDPNFFNNIKL